MAFQTFSGASSGFFCFGSDEEVRSRRMRSNQLRLRLSFSMSTQGIKD
jgi:hypothetical protein